MSEYIAHQHEQPDDELQDQQAVFQACNKAYRDLKHAGGTEWDRIVNLGKVGTIAGRAGGKAFGGARPRSQQRPTDISTLFSAPPPGQQIAVRPDEEPLAMVLSNIEVEGRRAFKAAKEAKQRDERDLADWASAELGKEQYQESRLLPAFEGARPCPQPGGVVRVASQAHGEASP
jgi:hypothetical protein